MPPPVAAAPAVAPEPAPPTAAPAAAPAEPVAPVPAPAHTVPPGQRCVLGEHRGVNASHARTVAALVCEELHALGEPVDLQVTEAPAEPTGGRAYRVEIQPLGGTVLLTVKREAPIGNIVDMRRLQISKLEESAYAAPRIAESLVKGTPIEETAAVDTLVGSETRRYEKKYGEALGALGVFGFGIPGSDVAFGYGALIRIYYETASYAVGGDLRLGGSTEENGDAMLFGIGVGGRYFFTQTEISPFLGAGLGILWLSADQAGSPDPNGFITGDNYDGSGAALSAEVGVEFLRFHGSRLDFMFRVDAPIFALHPDDSSIDDSIYALPLSLLATYSF